MSDLRKGPLFVGVGNHYRCDDGVGPWVAAVLADNGFSTQVHAGDGVGLITLFADEPSLVVIDATRTGAVAGSIVCIDAVAQSVPADMFHYSTHRFGLAEAVETARALGGLPRSLLVCGIEGGCFDAGEGLSEAVQKAAELLVAQAIRPKDTIHPRLAPLRRLLAP